MRPVTFAGCFGWLHQEGVGALGVVLCASWAYEAAAIGQSWRVLADRLAEAGLPTLRFDYPGCGDSLGSTDEPGAFDAATASIATAVEVLKANTGVSRVALIGIRLGGALALMTAEKLDVETVVMIRPVSRGKAFVSEQRALARILQAREPAAVRRDLDPGALEVEGFRLSPWSVEKMGKIDLAALRGAAPKRVMIAGEKGAAHYDALRDSLVARGAYVSRVDLAEVAAWGPAPAPPPPPLADCDAIASWLKEDLRLRALRPAAEEGLSADGFREVAVAFGPARTLTGILCKPAAPGAGRGAVVFLNTGANSHIGAGRAFVHHARDLAATGVSSLRMDIKGLGDSLWTEEGPLSAIHHVERTVDVSAAIDLLRGMGYESVALVGVCSGAFLAFQSALHDPRVDRIFIANPQVWLPPNPEQLADPLKGAYGSSSGYASKLFNLLTWKRLLTGDLSPTTIARIAHELGARAGKRIRALSERVSASLAHRNLNGGKLIDLLRLLKGRDCEVVLALSQGDPAHETLASLLPRGDLASLDGLVRIIVAEGADHAFVLPRTRVEFFALMCDFLGLSREPSSAPKAVHDRVAA
jgi:alpha-beta hydrolase superfamily lysophospholipase